MDQPRRTPRSLSAAPPASTVDRRTHPALSRMGVQAILLLGGLAVLGLRAQHSAPLPRLQVVYTPAAPVVVSDPARQAARLLRRPVAAVHTVATGTLAAPRHGAHRQAVATRRATPSRHRAPAAHTHRHAPHRPAVRRHHAVAGPPVVQALPPARQIMAVRSQHVSNGHALPAVSAAGDLERRALAPNPDARIMAPPSVSVAVIRQELRRGGSPLLDSTWADGKDAAQYIWDAGRVLGVDPAVLLAFFWHESQYGIRGMARLTYSVGNIRPLDGQPELNGYRFYRTWQNSVDDTYRLLKRYASHGLSDVASAVPVWAPSTDNNNVQAYIADVQATVAHYYMLSVPGNATASSGTELVAASR